MSLITYVLDTSVLLTDPRALHRFAEHHVVIPWATLEELEAKRHHVELGYFAREALRTLEALREKHGHLTRVPVNDEGGTLSVLNDFSCGTADNAIIATADELTDRSHDPVILVSNDLPMRLKATVRGLLAEGYKAAAAAERSYSGMSDADVTAELVDAMYYGDPIDLEDDLPVNSGVVLNGPSSSALARVRSNDTLALVPNHDAFGIRGRSAEQKVALDLLLDPDVGIVSLGGRAGTGKSVLAIAAALEQVVNEARYSRVVVFRPVYAVGGQELGHLPGSLDEKMAPWAQAVWDAVGVITTGETEDYIREGNLLEVQPLTHIRGRSLHDAFIIVDEAQSLEQGVLLTVLSRVGQNAKIVLTHDTAQRDNLHVGAYDGIVAVIDKLKGHPLFGHVTLTRSERSAIAELVTDLL